MRRRLGVARALVDGSFVAGDVAVEDGRITEVGVGGPGRGTAAPGFVDLQVNGFAGIDLLAADPDGYSPVGEALAATGVTAYQPTFMSAPPGLVDDALAVLTARRDDGSAGPRILGAHLEGPFLSPRHAGAHPVASLVDPDPDLVDRWLATGEIRQVTLAPELDGALGLVAHLVASGVVVACGHTDADAAIAHAAFDAGATTVTHLFNAMRPFHHRDPGIAGVALTRGDVTVQLIADGIHLSPEALLLAWRAAGDRLALATDATAAAGMSDGTFRLGGIEVRKQDLEVRCSDGTLAGSALTMDAAVRRAVDHGIEPAAALAAASTVPARIARAEPLGRLAPGAPADVVVLDDDLHVRATLVAGEPA